MFELLIKTTKGSLITLWALALLSLVGLSPLPEEYKFILLTMTGLVIVVHFIEYLAVKIMLKRKPAMEISFLQTMLWGFGYWLPLFRSKP